MAEKSITIRAILAEWLRGHGYDGLCCFEGDPCGCRLDDLAPCGEFFSLECIPGYEGPDVTGECDSLIFNTKKAAEAAAEAAREEADD